MNHDPRTMLAIQRAQYIALTVPLATLRNAANLCGDCARPLRARAKLGFLADRVLCLSCAVTRMLGS